MSMHEFEDLVEASIRTLVISERREHLDLRSMFWRLYQFQNCWDTGFTHFRVMDLLLKYHFVYRFEVNQHPDYTMYRDYFDNLTRFTFIKRRPLEKWDKKKNPAIGYYKPPYLYCDAGSPLWMRFVELGVLKGTDARPPDERISLIEVALEIVTEAERQSDLELIGLWYALLGTHLYTFSTEEELDALRENRPMAEILEVVKRTHIHEKLTNFRLLFLPPSTGIEDFPDLLRRFRDQAASDAL